MTREGRAASHPLALVLCSVWHVIWFNYLNRHPAPAFPFSQQGLAPWCLFHWPPGRPQRLVVNVSPGSQFSQTHREVGGEGGLGGGCLAQAGLRAQAPEQLTEGRKGLKGCC